jgi:Fe-Mn family superoxide dismutase
MSAKRFSRRDLLKSAAAGAVAVTFLLGTRAWAAAREHKLPELPYPRDALAPLISKETLDFHYGKHHAAYVANLNKLLAGTEFEEASLEEIIKTAKGPIFNNAAQVWNHTFYWNCLAPRAGGEPEGELAEAIQKAFGSFARFKEQFSKAATTQFGSGWAWLVRGPDGKLAVVATGNAGNPMTDGKTPLLTCDVWEHAYYIDYRNRRPDYVEAFWKLVNWKFASEQL